MNRPSWLTGLTLFTFTLFTFSITDSVSPVHVLFKIIQKIFVLA